MTSNIRFRAIAIVIVILVCIYGIIGLPTSKAQLMENLRNNIRLGLDLKGGSHLVLQVQIQDALKAEADQAIEGMKEELRKQGVDYASIDRNDPNSVEDADKIEITVKGVPAAKTTAFRTLVSDHFGDWVLTPVNSTDYRMNLKPSTLVALKRDTVDRSIQTISNRINQLGL